MTNGQIPMTKNGLGLIRQRRRCASAANRALCQETETFNRASQNYEKKFPLPIGERKKVRGQTAWENHDETKEYREIAKPFE